MEPVDLVVALEPRELLAHIAARVALDALHGLVERPFSVEMAEKFLVADGVQRVFVAQGKNAAGLVQQSFRHHLIDAPIDAVVEFFARAVEADFHNMKGSVMGVV